MSAKDLAEQFEVSIRTIYRDVETLSASGIPIYMQKGRNGGIRLLPNFILNKTILTKEEKRNIMTALNSIHDVNGLSLETTLEKLGMFFGKQNGGFIEVDYHDWGNRLKDSFEKIKQAILASHEITFLYVTAQNQKSYRTVEPYILWFKDRTWYLKAYCLEKKEKRIFRLSRMSDIQILENIYTARVLNWGEDNAKESNDMPGKQEEEESLVLWIAKEMEHRVMDEFLPEQVERTENGNFKVRVLYPLDEWVYGYICSFGPYARVLEPLETRNEIANRLKTAYEQYQEENSKTGDKNMQKLESYIDEKRLIDLFCELVCIDSVSFHEKEMVETIKTKLVNLGIQAKEDHAGEQIGGNAGNVYAKVAGAIEGSSLLFSAHLDTVEPGIGKEAKIEDGKVVSVGQTILGADDLGGVAVILEALRILKENQIPHRTLELIFPVAEEVYGKGSAVLDYQKIESKEAYVLDLSGKVGTASLQEPTLISFVIQILGKGAHAGFEPEKGINAIAVAAAAINDCKQGRISEDTTLNFGKIEGGSVTNAVPKEVKIYGEIRSYQHKNALEHRNLVEETFQKHAKAYGAKINFESQICINAYQMKKEEPVVKRFAKACEEVGLRPQYTKTFGGSDNNHFVRNNIKGIVLASAMEKVHTTDEYLEISELKKSLALVLALMTCKQ